MLAHKQTAEQRQFQDKTMAVIMGITEHAAGELFKWLTWALALGALDIVRVRTGAEWLLWVEWVLGVAIWLRIAWRLGPKPIKGIPTADGGQVLTFPRLHMLTGVLSMLITVGVVLIGAEVVRLVAAAELIRS